jgi:hypothetical protein
MAPTWCSRLNRDGFCFYFPDSVWFWVFAFFSDLCSSSDFGSLFLLVESRVGRGACAFLTFGRIVSRSIGPNVFTRKIFLRLNGSPVGVGKKDEPDALASQFFNGLPKHVQEL